MLVALLLGVIRLLAMVKDINGLHPIVVGKVFLQLIGQSIVLQLQRPFQEHVSPHQFGVSSLGGYEVIPFGIRTLLDLNPD